ncbi:MAG TPA: hypothetical protein PKE21_06940 [Flavobacteriales bacterium]|nr:hypothetical protein [Flavobacteriales bacterium]HMR27196.1 hypothetical protein [Flavobacteriales bacterium]
MRRWGNMDRLPPAVHATTAALCLNIALALFGGPAWLIGGMLLAGPGLVLWLVWSVLRDRSVPVRDLGAREQWGYQDRPDIRPVEER